MAGRVAPAAERNKGPILAVLQSVLPRRGLVLEIASGTGQHVVHWAQALPQLDWQPSDADAGARASIVAWTEAAGLSNIRPPLALDVRARPWPIQAADALVCINMIHVAPWAATEALLAGAAALLPAGGVLFLYGPYRRNGEHTAPSNAGFDADLRAQDGEWGVRDLDEVADVAAAHGFTAPDVVAMPANNLSVIFRSAAPAS